MSKIKVIGLDLAKSKFHYVGCNRQLKIVERKQLSRNRLLTHFANLPRCRVGLEACASAHYWARDLEALGFEVKLIPPQYVKSQVRGNKNDYNDALAIAESAVQGEMRFVPIKSAAQQDLQAVHRLRAKRIAERTALCNQLRGLLAEYGLILPRGVSALRNRLPGILDDADNCLSPFIRTMFWQGYHQLLELDEHVDFFTAQIKHISRKEDGIRRLQTIPGFGEIVSSAFSVAIGNGRDFRRGRDVSASIGLVPKQHSTGGKDTLLGISKRGDKYLRSLLIHGARAVVSSAKNKDDQLSQWINRLRERRGFNKAVVAYANKMARMGWAVTVQQSEYRLS